MATNHQVPQVKPKRVYPLSCECGICPKCKHRTYVRGWSADRAAQAKVIQRRSYLKHRERRAAEVRAWQAANPDKTAEIKRRYHVKQNFGLEWSDYLALVAVRGNVCWICASPEPGRKKSSMCVDHDHATGAVRGILCNGCNIGLANFKDDPARLAAAIAYLAGDLT